MASMREQFQRHQAAIATAEAQILQDKANETNEQQISPQDILTGLDFDTLSVVEEDLEDILKDLEDGVLESERQLSNEEDEETTEGDIKVSTELSGTVIDPIDEVTEIREETTESKDEELDSTNKDTSDTEDQEEVTDPLSIVIDDVEIFALDKIDSKPFTENRSDRYKTIKHSDVLIAFEQNIQALNRPYERKKIWTGHLGAVMTAEYELTDTSPHTNIFIRNSYNGMHALGMIVGMSGKHMYVFNDYRAIHRRHTKNADLDVLMAVAVTEITTEYSKGKRLLTVMDNINVHTHYDHVAMATLTERDLIWHTFVEGKAMPISLLPKVVAEYNKRIKNDEEVSVLAMYQVMANKIKKTNTRDRVVMQHRDLMTSVLKAINSKQSKADDSGQ